MGYYSPFGVSKDLREADFLRSTKFAKRDVAPAYNNGKSDVYIEGRKEEKEYKAVRYFYGRFVEFDEEVSLTMVNTVDPLLTSDEAKYKFAMDVHRLSKRYLKGQVESQYWNEPFMKEFAVKEVDALEEKLADLKEKRDNFKETFFKKNPYRAEALLYEEKLACVYELLERE